jgi:hypothetical protein
MLHKDYYCKDSVKKSLVTSLKGLDAKTNGLAENLQAEYNFEFDFDFRFNSLDKEFCRGGCEERT